MEQIYHFFNIKSTDLNQIFEAINTAEEIQKWWTSGTTKNENILGFTFMGHPQKAFKIIEISAPKKVVWECITETDGWFGTKIEFLLKPNKNGTTDLSFRHFDWKEQSEFFGSCNYHWGLYMKSLKSYIETGVGTPHTF